MAVPGPGGMVREVKEKKVRSREEKEERQETEDIHHLGDITDEVSPCGKARKGCIGRVCKHYL